MNEPQEAQAHADQRIGAEPVVVIPLSGPTEAAEALPVARVLADHEGATLHALVIGDPDVRVADLVDALGIRPDALHGAVVDRAAGPAPAATIRLARESNATRIVLSARPAGPEVESGLSAVVEEVLAGAPCPVVVVPPGGARAGWTIERILAPHDGTPTTAEAVHAALELAARADAGLTILHVAEPGAGRPSEPGTFTTPRYVDQPQHEWPAWAHEFLERCAALGMPAGVTKIRIVLAAGEPAREILGAASTLGTDLIVIGWHGHLEGERASTMKSVIRGAPCPVLTLRVGS